MARSAALAILIGFTFVALFGVLMVSSFDHHAAQPGCIAALLFGKECAPTDNALAQVAHHGFTQQLTSGGVFTSALTLLTLFLWFWLRHARVKVEPPHPYAREVEFVRPRASLFEYLRSWLALLEAQPDGLR